MSKDKSQILAILSGITFAVTETMPWPPFDKKLHAEMSSPEYRRKSSALKLRQSTEKNLAKLKEAEELIPKLEVKYVSKDKIQCTKMIKFQFFNVYS